MIDWQRMNNMVPAVIQHAQTGAVLMLGYMTPEALQLTRDSGRVTFWSRSKQRLWTKGETSGHYLHVRQIAEDCDGDTLLILAEPAGPACHNGTPTCFGVEAPRSAAQSAGFLTELEALIADRIAHRPAGSYTTELLEQGTRRIAQKVGEEALELALAAVAQTDAEIVGEAADLLYHTLLLLQERGLSLAQVTDELARRHHERRAP